jgi:uncharacterized membrane protein
MESRLKILGHPVHPMLIVYPLGLLPSIAPALLGLIGAAVALATAWLGGELVYRLRVGVDDDAGLDASNSLAREGAVDLKA